MSQLTFSKECRTEALENFKFSKKDCCNISFLKGYFFNDTVRMSDGAFIHVTNIEKSAKSVKKLLSRYNIESDILFGEDSFQNSVTQLVISDMQSIIALHNLLTDETEECDRCITNYLTGIFIDRCTLNDPAKNYAIEFTVKDRQRCDKLLKVLSDNGFDFKKSVRKNSYVIYSKNSQVIEDFLATVGAQNSFMNLVQSKVEKDVRNRINRRTNCEAANIAKAVKASYKYKLAVDRLTEQGLFESLPDDIKQPAMIKAENPEIPLSQLGAMCNPPMTKSTVNRKLNKLCRLAQIEE